VNKGEARCNQPGRIEPAHKEGPQVRFAPGIIDHQEDAAVAQGFT
jgi:hypothetical protein